MNRSRCLFRGLTALLAVLIAVSSFCLPASASAFSDVTRSAYYAYFDAINYVSDNGYMAGTGNGKFSPDRTLNRGMFVTVLYSFAGKPLATGTIPFTDVSSTAYYYQAVRWAYANGVLSGTTSTTFSPDMEVNREQAMVFLKSYAVKWLGKDAYYCETVTSAGDYSNISSWARDAMRWAVSNGILIRANASSNLYPKAAADRKELALWICRFGQNVIGMDFSKDTFSFENKPEDFLSATYKRFLISTVHYNRLFAHATPAEQRLIRDMRTATYAGSCYGMSLVCILDKLGQIDFNGNYAKNCNTMHAIPSPKAQYTSIRHELVQDSYDGSVRMTQAESAINYYLMSQRIQSLVNPQVDARAFGIESPELNANLQGVEEFFDAMKHNGLALLCLGSPQMGSAGHCVIVYGHPELTAQTNTATFYSLPIYNPNSATKEEITFRKEGGNYTYCTIPGIQVSSAYYYTNFQPFYALDIDDAGNTQQSIVNAFGHE